MKMVAMIAFILMCCSIMAAVWYEPVSAQLTPQEMAVMPADRSGPKCSKDELGWLGRGRVKFFGYPKACFDERRVIEYFER